MQVPPGFETGLPGGSSSPCVLILGLPVRGWVGMEGGQNRGFREIEGSWGRWCGVIFWLDVWRFLGMV